MSWSRRKVSFDISGASCVELNHTLGLIVEKERALDIDMQTTRKMAVCVRVGHRRW